MKSTLFALLLVLLLPAMPDVSAQQSKPRISKQSSFKSGFSSQRAASTSSSRGPSRPSPSFGAFGGGAGKASQQRSDSVLSQRLDKSAAEANALRTLDARRAAAQARRDAQQPLPVPYDSRAQDQAPMHFPAPSPIVVQQASNGLGNIVTGFLLGRATSNGHAHASVTTGSGRTEVATPASGGSFFGALLRTFAWLAILAAVGWVSWYTWKFLRRRHAPSSANYSFER